MQRSLYHWTYEDVRDFLIAKGFQFFDEVEGMGQAWMSFQVSGEPDRIVEVTRTDAFYNPKALKRMIRQSGIPEDEWLAC